MHVTQGLEKASEDRLNFSGPDDSGAGVLHIDDDAPPDLAVDDVAGRIMTVTRDMAIAIKRAWNPDGVSTRQHNEPAGSQHVWHYHQHVLPRWHDDGFYFTPKRPIVDPAIRARKAGELRAAL